MNIRHTFLGLLSCMAVSVAALSAANASVIAVDVTSDLKLGAGRLQNLGWQFQVNSPVVVDALGVFDFDPAGLIEGHEVGVWDNLGALIAHTVVTNSSTPVPSASSLGDWLFESIAPTTLVPGTYVIGAFYDNRSFSEGAMYETSISVVPEITFVTSRSSSAFFFAEPGADGSVDPGWFGPNLRIAPAPVPEPGTLSILAVGLLGAGATRLRKRTAAQS